MLQAIIYREFYIFKNYFLGIFLSYFSNIFFILLLIFLFNQTELSENLFYFIAYFLLITQTQIWVYIFNENDQIEHIFEYYFSSFPSKLQFCLIRLGLIFFLNLFFIEIIYFLYFHSILFQANHYLFLMSALIIIINIMSFTMIINERKNYINYFLYILLLPLNLPAFGLVLLDSGKLIFISIIALITAIFNFTLSVYLIEKK